MFRTILMRCYSSTNSEFSVNFDYGLETIHNIFYVNNVSMTAITYYEYGLVTADSLFPRFCNINLASKFQKKR